MGYTTYFTGSLEFNKEVTEELKNFINKFSSIRHMKRDNNMIKEIYPDWENNCYKGDIGNEGQYFIGCDKIQNRDDSILEFNRPSQGVPGLWCQWIINDEGELEWDGNEKFYNYEEWLIYLIDRFFTPEGYVLNGTISFQGENDDDFGEIIVVDNNVTLEYGIHVMSLSEIDDLSLIEELEKRGYKVS